MSLIAVPCHVPDAIVPTEVSEDATTVDPSVVPDKIVAVLCFSTLPFARSICSDDVHESVASTQFQVLEESAESTVIPAPSAAASLAADLAIVMFLSVKLMVVDSTVVVEPCTVKLPVRVRLVAASVPSFELNVRLLPVTGDLLPVAAVTNTGKQVVSVDSSATVILDAAPVTLPTTSPVTSPTTSPVNEVPVIVPVTARTEPLNVRLPLSSSSPEVPARTTLPDVRSAIAADVAETVPPD